MGMLLESLKQVKRERDRLVGFLHMADQHGADKNPSVLKRLRDDYLGRLRALNERAAPAMKEARQHLSKLQSTKAKLLHESEQICLDKEEIELRGAVGELEGEDLEKKLAEAGAKLKQSEDQVEQADTLGQQFLEFLKSFDDDEFDWSDGGHPEHTVVVPQPPEPPGDDEEKTVVVPKATLTAENNKQKYQLHRFTLIGRERCHIVLDEVGVSRKHATVTFDTNKGFTIKDDGSSFGTFVNGEKVTEHLLADGDTIRIGGTNLVFNCSKPSGKD